MFLCLIICLTQIHGDPARPVWLQAAESAYRFMLGSIAGGERLHKHTSFSSFLSKWITKKLYLLQYKFISNIILHIIQKRNHRPSQ